MTTLIITTFNRPNYLAQCFGSLQKLTTWPDRLIIVDDFSQDLCTTSLIYEMKNYFAQHIPAEVLLKTTRNGIRDSISSGTRMAFSEGADIVINLDSDMIVKPDFIYRMVEMKKRFPDNMVSGINVTMTQRATGLPRNPIISEHEDYFFKKYVGGCCLCYDKSIYAKYILPSLEINGNWDHNTCLAMEKDGLPVVVLKPSAAQHIGYESSMGHTHPGAEAPDKADDFDEKIQLPDLTLFGINAHNPEGLLRAAEICQRHIQFGDVKIITERLFPGNTLEEGRRNYSAFMIKQLYRYFNTSHVLVMNDDAYIQNPQAWDDSWLHYDYIGATWNYKDNMNVGNGGFSLRSKRLCEILSSDQNIVELHPEDHHIARTYRRYLEEKYEIKFAPEEVANRFAIEAYGSSVFPNGNRYSGQFGHHGPHVAGLPIPQTK